MALANEIEVLSLFVEDFPEARSFYLRVFAPKIVFEDEVSAVLEFGGLMINLLAASEAPTLVKPTGTAPAVDGASMLLTIKVPNVDAACADLQSNGVTLLNGPLNRPWGRRTAAFADPSGHVWEVAQELT